MNNNLKGPTKGQKHTDVKRSAFGKRLFTTRKARGFSQSEFGKKIGLSKRMVSFYEGDTQGPPAETVVKMAKVLDVTTRYLLGKSPGKTIKDPIAPALWKHITTLQKLPDKDKKMVLRMVEALATQNGTLKKE